MKTLSETQITYNRDNPTVGTRSFGTNPDHVAFYEKVVGATVIPDSTPGIYAGLLRKND